MNTKTIIIFIAVLFVLDLLLQLYRGWKRNDLFTQLSRYLADKDFAAFDELLASPQTKRVLPPFNIAFLKLNEALILEDEKMTDESFDSFNMTMTKSQKEVLYKRGFYYYLDKRNKDKTDHYYELLRQMNVADLQTLDVMYDTYILKGSKYLDIIRNAAEKAGEKGKMPYYSLLADIYQNIGDKDKEKEYRKIVKDYTDKLIGK
ncbi:MAG: hypothetical protein IJI77_01220 [Erysipelotrichaceae bacterium]|nr:hypothetical protein [Erysipelotrichaceae bacterium]